METFETLWKYCSLNERAFPTNWDKLYRMLKISSGGSKPPLPLILGAWWFTTPKEKTERFKEQIQWAFDNNQIEEVGKYLRALKEDEWTRMDELPSGKT